MESTALFSSLFSSHSITTWAIFAAIALGLVLGVTSGYFKSRKIQPRGFKWRVFRNEIGFAALNLVGSALLLGPLTNLLIARGFIQISTAPSAWWIVALQFAGYFFLFDTWFYWLHRWMHKEPYYSLVHKLHHRSTSPNLLTTLSVNPLESLVNGGFAPIFMMLFTVDETTRALISTTTIVMGLYVHTGYEFLPRWWNRSWATKWFITTTFHDQHHQYFNWNFGGFTTIWDYLCGTVRKKYEHDFENPKARRPAATAPAAAPVSATAAVEPEAV
jgi:Delta7-sterol 5-desaturase